MKLIASLTIVLLCAVGCAQHEYNPTQPAGEEQVLTHTMQLTRGFERAGEAYFSPDMTWIIFQATPRGEKQYQMFVAPLQYNVGASERQLLRTPVSSGPIRMGLHDIIGVGTPIRISPPNSRNTCGFFSPDGLSLIFASTAGKEQPDEPTSGYQREGRDYRWSFPSGMEIFRADGWQGAVAVAESGKIIDLAQHPITDNNSYDAECAYSPDGKWIIFSSNRDAPTSRMTASSHPSTAPSNDLDLYAMRADGTHLMRLTSAPGYDGGPFFSPDGKRIVYRSDRKSNNLLQVYVADLVFDRNGDITGTSHERPLTHDANVNWGPYWHPDGKHIIYATSKHGHTNYELYLMRVDGTRKTRITFADGADVLPVFSPDGRYLMWTNKRAGDGTTQIFVARFTMPEGA